MILEKTRMDGDSRNFMMCCVLSGTFYNHKIDQSKQWCIVAIPVTMMKMAVLRKDGKRNMELMNK